MRLSTLELLACPACRANLSLQDASAPVDIQAGKLVCSGCQRVYPIQRGIPRFIQPAELEGLNKPLSHLYDWFSLIYSAFSKVGFRLLGTTEKRARSELLARLELNGGKLLEVSIGPGVNLPYLFSSFTVDEVHGLDISPGQLKRCSNLIQRRKWPVELSLANGEQLPYKDNSFEHVFHIGGINFFSHPEKAVLEMIRVAKPGTRIIICDENESGAKLYEKFLPGFKGVFSSGRDEVKAPIDLVPHDMQELSLTNIWNNFMYCLEFRKPIPSQ